MSLWESKLLRRGLFGIIIDRAKQFYEQRRDRLEAENDGEFVAIEPDSGDYFFAATFDDAVRAARDAHSDRITHTIRIGHPAAFHIGLMER